MSDLFIFCSNKLFKIPECESIYVYLKLNKHLYTIAHITLSVNVISIITKGIFKKKKKKVKHKFSAIALVCSTLNYKPKSGLSLRLS